jgi:ATP-dependent exoDNAse (exonuclease V) beta subunit
MIEFDPVGHTYTNTDTGEQYISVTTLIGKYESEFDADFHAERISKRDGIAKEVILETWEKIRVRATDKGSMIHNLLEDYIKTGKKEPKLPWLFTEFDKLIKENVFRHNKMHSEMVLWNHEYKIAGMADVVIEWKDYFFIVDFKTNKAFNFESKFNDYLFEPLDHLAVCEFNNYCLQLSTYAYMYEQSYGKKLKKMFILYLRPDKKSFDVIHLNYMKSEVRNLLDHYKHNYSK